MGSLLHGQGKLSSLRIDSIMLFPVEILLLIIVAKTYYFYMDTVNGTKNLRYLEITKSRDLVIASVVSLSVFGNTLRSEAISIMHLENSFVISTAFFSNRTVVVFCCQHPEGKSHPFLYWNCFSEPCISLCEQSFGAQYIQS